jgi:hypothetical protein
LQLSFERERADKEINVTRQQDSIILENVKKELQGKINDRDLRLSSIERHIGDKSFWDLSTLMVTPLQMKNLGQNYLYHEEIHCFLSVPDSASWKPITVDGIDRQMLFGNPKPADDPDFLSEFQKKRKIYVWKGPGVFKINTGDAETPILLIFPYVSIEEFNNKDYSEMLITETKILKTQIAALNGTFKTVSQAFNELGQKIHEMAQKLGLNNDPAHRATSGQGPLLLYPQSNPGFSDIYFEKFTAGIEERLEGLIPPLDSDSSAFWASQFIIQGFQLAKKIPNSSFHILNTQQKGNVFYLSIQTVFPASNTTAKINWDQELILIGTGKTTLTIWTSSPWSADMRGFAEGPWIAAWLAGLKIPLEPQ